MLLLPDTTPTHNFAANADPTQHRGLLVANELDTATNPSSGSSIVAFMWRALIRKVGERSWGIQQQDCYRSRKVTFKRSSEVR